MSHHDLFLETAISIHCCSSIGGNNLQTVVLDNEVLSTKSSQPVSVPT